jgi:hypothetical protein
MNFFESLETQIFSSMLYTLYVGPYLIGTSIFSYFKLCDNLMLMFAPQQYYKTDIFAKSDFENCLA